MDLYAFAQIDALEKIMLDNGISVPRLRGLRLMANETPISQTEIYDSGCRLGLYDCEFLCESDFILDSGCYELSSRTDRIKKKYLIYDKDHMVTGVRWGNIHGKKRKLFKYVIKRATRAKQHQLGTFNKYCGRSDILYIHARIGGGNWSYYHAEVDTQPWFIEKVDDAFDSTYCDIYAQIKLNAAAREGEAE